MLPYYLKLKTLYSVAGKQVAFVQSFAILEVFHVLLGFVPSPLGTTAMQVASRLWLVWGIVERFPEVRLSNILDIEYLGSTEIECLILW